MLYYTLDMVVRHVGYVYPAPVGCERALVCYTSIVQR
jgi:hypothetical protein